MKPSDEFNRRRRARSVVTALVLGGIMILIYAITLSKMHHGG